MKNSKSLREEDPIRLPYFDWDKAKYFYYIAKLGSFSETGKFLNISQPSLSRKISILEDHLKCKLFTRTPKGLELTRKGEQLFAIIEQTFLELKGFNYEAAAMTTDGQKRRIRISTTHPVAAYIVAEHVISYALLHPDILFEIVVDDHLIDLVINDVDIAIRPYDPTAKGVHQEHFFTLVKKLFASSKYLEKYGEPQTVEDLRYHHVIAHARPEENPYSDLTWILRVGMPEGKLREPSLLSSSFEAAVIAANRGLGIIGSYEQLNIIKNLNLKNILPDVMDTPVKWCFIYPKHFQNDEKIKEIMNHLQEYSL